MAKKKVTKKDEEKKVEVEVTETIDVKEEPVEELVEEAVIRNDDWILTGTEPVKAVIGLLKAILGIQVCPLLKRLHRNDIIKTQQPFRSGTRCKDRHLHLYHPIVPSIIE